jgi:hypothetical protein
MKLFFTVYAHRNNRLAFRKADLSDGPGMNETRHMLDHQSIAIEFDVHRGPDDPVGRMEVQSRMNELLGRALFLLSKPEREMIAREAGMVLIVNE